MIATIAVKVNAAKPNFPLQPMFAFQGSPSSLRILDVPKSIGNWAITSVKVAVEYPDNTTVEKVAVRSGSVWVATVEGCDVAGKVSNGYSVLADGKDEDGNDVTGYVLGKGDVFILENDTELSRLVGKIAVRYLDDIPDNPTTGDLMNSNGQLRLFDGNNWILISTGEHSVVYDSQITIQKNGTSVGSFTLNASEPKSIDIPVPSRTSDIENDSGFITVAAIPSDISAFNNDMGYITASAIPSNVGAFTNDVGYLTASDVSTSALYPSSPYSAYVQIDDYGDVNAKKLLNETGVWFVKAIMELYTTNPVTGYWVSNPKITDNGTNLLVEFWVQDKERKYEPEKITYDAASPLATEMLIAVTFHNVGFRVQLKKSTQADLPVWIDCGRLVRDGDANTGLRISQLEDDIGLVHDISEKRDLTDISYPASVDPTGMYTISKFTVDGVLYDMFGTGYPSTDDSYWTDDGEYHTNCVWTSDGTNYQLHLSGTDFGSTFTFAQLKSGSVEVTSSEVSHTVVATFKQTTFALKDYVDAAIPSNVSELNNDVGYVTASAIPSNVSEFNNDAGYLTANSESFKEKRDYFDLSYIPINDDMSDGFGISTWTLNGTEVSGMTFDVITASGESQPLAYWQSNRFDVKSYDGKTFYWLHSYASSWHPFNILDLPLTFTVVNPGGIHYTYVLRAVYKNSRSTKLALVSDVPSNIGAFTNDVGYITASAIPSNVSEFNNDVGYLTASSSAFVAKRDKTDMSAVVGTTYASWNLSALHSTTYSPALELKWGTYNVFGEEQECWLVDDEYRQVCFFLLPELNMLYWGVKNQDGSYIAGYGETITLSSDELSIATINGVAEITCTRTSKEGSPEVSTIATMKDLQGFQNINEKRDWWDNTIPASVDATGKFTINTFSVMVGSSSYVLDQFSKSGSTSTWKTTSGDYPNITTTDGLNFTLNYDSSTTAYFTMGELKPGPAKGTIGGSNFNVYANFKMTTFALKDWVDANCTTYSYVDSNLNVSGIGCSTVTMSGTYLNSSTFSYNLVVQPAQ